jgi:hypothetical protein
MVTEGDHVDEIQKTREEWNGAGTFGLLVTLPYCEIKRSMDDVKNTAED